MLSARARLRGMILTAEDYESSPNARRCIWHCPTGAAVHLGRALRAHRRICIRATASGDGRFHKRRFLGVGYAPINKDVICQSGINFSGHNRISCRPLPSWATFNVNCRADFARGFGDNALALCKVPAALSEEGIFHNIKTLAEGLGRHFGISKPKIKVAGLNPHAGEGGFLGDEEIRIIKPAILRAQEAGILASGPFPADTLFIADKTSPTDAVLAMYHDQGLPVVKFADFDGTINITLGLLFCAFSGARHRDKYGRKSGSAIWRHADGFEHGYAIIPDNTVRARRRFGQNFLRDENIIAAIIVAISPAQTTKLLKLARETAL